MNSFEILSTRDSFNRIVRHVKATVKLSDSLAKKENIADLVALIAEDTTMESAQISAFVNMLLVDRLKYSALSNNLALSVENIADLSKEFSKWKALDIVFSYHHPDLGLLVVNPKNKEQMKALDSMRKRELMVVYAGYVDKPADELCTKAINTFIALIEGRKVKVDEKLYTGSYTFKKLKKEKPAPAASRKAKTPVKRKPGRPAKVAASAPAEPEQARQEPAVVRSAARRMTPFYSVVVQNELFHNGNVEAWKRIIASYKAKYPELEVFIYYEGERIVDINALFKWGKVKHGSSIQFAVAGSDIRDVAKLQRYLSQGASSMFEAFLQGPVSSVLHLF